MAKVKMINNTPLSSYLQHLILHVKFLSLETAVDLLQTFPNIQSIIGLNLISTKFNSANDKCPLQKLTHFLLWYTKSNKNWMKTLIKNSEENHDKYKPKSLEFKINNDDFNPLTVPIQFKSISDHIIVIFHLPSILNCLTNLNIGFFINSSINSTISSNINEDTLHSIHQSCPKLESLTLKNFIMYTSKEFYSNESPSDDYQKYQQKMILLSSSSSTTRHLKHIKLDGKFTDPECYTFLSSIYPQLISLELGITWFYISEEKNSLFASAIQSMMSQLKSLKILSIRLYHPDYSLHRNSINNSTDLKPFCGYNEFLKWIQKHPTQLDNLLLKHYFSTDIDSMINMNHHQHLFLNHLTTLSMQLTQAIDLVCSYLSQNKNQIIVSPSISILNLEGDWDHKVNWDDLKRKMNYPFQSLNINDWLDIFPNLKSLDLKRFNYIKDYDDGDDDDDEYDYWDSIRLHTLLKQRRQKVGAISNKTVCYNKLEHISIAESVIYLQKGISQLFNRSRHLKKIILDSSYYLPIVEERSKNIPLLRVDLSYHNLDYLYIKNIYLIPRVDEKVDFYIITVLDLHEPFLDRKNKLSRAYQKCQPAYTHFTFNLCVKCNYVDCLLFNI
ncbi:unnamed protein product [Cunninghamella blakesleeana]